MHNCRWLLWQVNFVTVYGTLHTLQVWVPRAAPRPWHTLTKPQARHLMNSWVHIQRKSMYQMKVVPSARSAVNEFLLSNHSQSSMFNWMRCLRPSHSFAPGTRHGHNMGRYPLVQTERNWKVPTSLRRGYMWLDKVPWLEIWLMNGNNFVKAMQSCKRNTTDS